MPKRRHKVLPLSEKVKFLKEKKKKCILRLLRSLEKNKSINKIVKKGKKIKLVFLSHLKLRKLQPPCVILSLSLSIYRGRERDCDFRNWLM